MAGRVYNCKSGFLTAQKYLGCGKDNSIYFRVFRKYYFDI